MAGRWTRIRHCVVRPTTNHDMVKRSTKDDAGPMVAYGQFDGGFSFLGLQHQSVFVGDRRWLIVDS